jgi:5-methylcytosine-specific restriction endonuclease McrA
MSNGKPSRIARHAKAALQWLDYLTHKPTLWAMTARPAKTQPERMRLSLAERIRFKYWLYWKYGPECAYCHRAGDWRHGLTIDHIQPVSKGGPLRDVRNMVLACLGCNRDKGDAWED